MKRHPSLQPFSRDHNVSLILARHLEREPSSDRLREFILIWDGEMDDHFFEEERVLLKFVEPDQGARLINEHMRIRQYVVAGRRGMLCDGDIVRLGGLIHEHVRWEERTLFPALEEKLSPSDLDEIGQEAERMELRHKASNVHSLLSAR